MFTKLKYNLFLYFILLGIVPLVSVLVVEYYQYTEALKSRSFDQLKTIRGIKKREVENYFSQAREEITLFAQSKTIIESMKDFKKSFHAIKPKDLPKGYTDKLKTYYLSEFRENVNDPDKDTIDFLSLIPSDPKSILLQTQYLIGNKSLYTSLPYHKVHNQYHTILSDFLVSHGYYDLMLIDDETGHIVYSVDKETDFATSLLNDAYANSNIGKLFRKIRYSGVANQAILCDFERYLPSYLAPASFMAAPIFEGDKKIGTLIFQIPADKIDAITTNKKIWREEGLGETGECYIIGKDCKLRTNSRFILESPDRFYETMAKNNYSPTLLSQMKFYKTTILFQVSCNESIVKSSAKQTGVNIVKDYRGIEVLSAYTNLNIEDVSWSLLSEMDTSEAFSFVSAYKKRAFIIAAIILIILLISISFISRSIYKPINALAAGARELGKGNLDVRVIVNTRDELQSLAHTFNLAVASLKNNRDEILQNSQLLEEQKEEIESQSERLRKLNEEIMEVNSDLDQKVAERTSALRRQNKKLIEYAFINSHKLRAPVATILGLMNLIKITSSVEEKLKCVELLEKTTIDLDNVIHEIQEILDEAEFKDE
jgi:HAMP domain-containing protein